MKLQTKQPTLHDAFNLISDILEIHLNSIKVSILENKVEISYKISFPTGNFTFNMTLTSSEWTSHYNSVNFQSNCVCDKNKEAALHYVKSNINAFGLTSNDWNLIID